MRKLLALILAFFYGVAAANNNDDGFVWIDANTRIKVVKPVSAAAGETKAAEPAKKDKKPEKSRK
jgi:hypothetical protein